MSPAERPTRSAGSLRVAMVVDRFPHEPFIAQQVSALIDAGIDVHVLCQIRDAGSPAWSLLDTVDVSGRIHPWPDRDRPLQLAAAAAGTMASAGRRSRRALSETVRAERTLATERLAGRVLFDGRVVAIDPDVLHFQFADLALRRSHAARAVGAAFTSSFRGYDLAYAGLDHPGGSHRFYDPLWPVLDGAHTLGDDLVDLARHRGCPDALPWTLIPPAVDTNRFRAPDRSHRRDLGTDRPVRIVSVGRLHWKKGHHDGLAAIARLRATGLQVRHRIVGSGDMAESIRWAIDDLGLGDVVELVGAADADGVANHLRWADLFLHPALTEGFGNAPLEAQAMGLPVVTTDAEGLAANVEHGVTGFVVARRDPAALSAPLAELAGDDAKRFEMGRAGRVRVVDRFGLPRQTAGFVDFFERAARAARR